MQDLSLYENVVTGDMEFPVRLVKNHVLHNEIFFQNHWHEHVEIHYIVCGESDIYCNQNKYHVVPGNLLIINSNEPHQGLCTRPLFESLVLIFDMDTFSREIAGHHLLFQPLIQQDSVLSELFLSLFEENTDRRMGYKIAMKGKIYDLIVHLMRHYVTENLSEQEGLRRKRNLDRLNLVLNYMEQHYMNPITTEDFASLVSLSPGRFSHIFKECMGLAPSAYLNQLRLKKAYNLLKRGTFTSTEVAFAVGFSDYNNFGRQFKRQYHVPPSAVSSRF